MMYVYVEPRPRSDDPSTLLERFVVETEADDVLKSTKRQNEAIDWAQEQGYTVYVARARHLTDKRNPNHWRKA